MTGRYHAGTITRRVAARGVVVRRIQLDADGMPAGVAGGNQGRARAAEEIEHDATGSVCDRSLSS